MTLTLPTTKRPTFLFTDIVDSSKMANAIPRARYLREIQRPHDRVILTATARYHGYRYGTVGDSFLLIFDSALDALDCACLIQESLHENPIMAVDQKQRKWTLAVRIGIHTAENDTRSGAKPRYRSLPDVNFAARVQSLASPEQIVVSAETWRAVEVKSRFEGKWQFWPDRWIKSFEESPQTLYELLWDGTKRAPPGAHWMPKFLLRDTGTFVGRDTYLENVVDWLKGDRPVLLLHGSGGVGKSRLAAQASLAVSSHYQGRIYGVSLDAEFPVTPESAASVSPDELAQRIAIATEAPEEVMKNATAERVIADLEQRFIDLQFLLVLDNFESVNNAGNRAFLGDLARRVPTIRCLVTCRANFDISPLLDSREVAGFAYPNVETEPLAEYDAYQLFRDRVCQSEPPRDLTDTKSLFCILQATDGSALGIELVAARYRLDATLSLKKIANGLHASLLEWQRAVPERDTERSGQGHHQSIGASINWSLSTLPTEERILFPRLGVFPADFDQDAAMVISGANGDSLARWVLAHLLKADSTRGRYVLQPVIREFSVKSLAPVELDNLRDRFAEHYAQVVGGTGDVGGGAHQITNILDSFDDDAHNLMAALDRSIQTNNVSQGLCLSGALGYFWEVRGYFQEAYESLEKLLKLSRGEKSIERARALNIAGHLAWFLGHFDVAKEYQVESLDICETIQDIPGSANAKASLGDICYAHTEFPEALILQTEALILRRGIGDLHGIAVSLTNLGNIRFNLEEYAEAEKVYKDCYEIVRELADQRLLAHTMTNLGTSAFMQAHYAESRHFHEQALKLFRSIKDKHGVGLAQVNLAGAAIALEDDERGRHLYRDSLTILAGVGDFRVLAFAFEGLATLAHAQKDFASAVKLSAAASRFRKRIAAPLPARNQTEFDEQLTEAKTCLGEERYNIEWWTGDVFSVSEALAFAKTV